jgi:5'-deoxynucleotidase YfbR-like HD superfamily hydrolase
MSPWIQTNSAVKFFPFEPQPEDIRLEDVAHALSRLCRFTGHVEHFYPVSAHCVAVLTVVSSLTDDLNTRKWALLHDTAEAFIGDMSAPIKSHPSMEPFRRLEAKVMEAVATRFGLEGPEPELVKKVDTIICRLEAEALFKTVHTDFPDFRTVDPAIAAKMDRQLTVHDFQHWNSHTAELEFLRRCRLLGIS